MSLGGTHECYFGIMATKQSVRGGWSGVATGVRRSQVPLVSCNFAIHVSHKTCPLGFVTYKYSELQVFSTTQRLNCKANCKTPFFSHTELT